MFCFFFFLVGWGGGGQHSALFKALKQESAALVFQNQAGEGNEIPTTHPHLPGPTGDVGQGLHAQCSQWLPREPGQCWPHPAWQGTHCLPEYLWAPRVHCFVTQAMSPRGPTPQCPTLSSSTRRQTSWVDPFLGSTGFEATKFKPFPY